MFHKNGAAGAYRMVPAETKTLEALGYTKHLATLKRCCPTTTASS